jgi:RHS repeat-associated protein
MIPHCTTETFNNSRGSPDIQCRGNRTQKIQPAGAGKDAATWHYTFNIFNKMTKVEREWAGMKGAVGFKYGADGYRVEKSVLNLADEPLSTIHFILDGVHVILEKEIVGEDDPVTVARYIPGVCMITRDYNNQPVIRYYHQDALGSNVAMTDAELPQNGGTRSVASPAAAGRARRSVPLQGALFRRVFMKWESSMTDEEQNITALYQSDAWGNELLATEDVPNPYRWNGASGYYRDADVQLYLLGMRWYDAETGRFVTRDPIGLDGGDANLKRYVGNNPYNSIDPNGLVAWLAIGTVVCCGAWLGISAWKIYDKFNRGYCSEYEGGERVGCTLLVIVGEVVSGPDILEFALCGIEAIWYGKKSLRECADEHWQGALLDAVKILAILCCLKGVAALVPSSTAALAAARAFLLPKGVRAA